MEIHAKFNIAFSKIMKRMTPDLQKKWNGTIDWPAGKSTPNIPAEIVEGMTPEAKAAYVLLLNNLSRDLKKNSIA